MTWISFPTGAYVAEILLAELIFLWSFEKRRGFRIRLIGSVLFCLLCGVLFPANAFERHTSAYAIFNFIKFFSLFSLTVGAMVFCYKVNPVIVLSLCTAGYAVQHIVQRTYAILSVFLPIWDNVLSVYAMTMIELAFFLSFYAIFLAIRNQFFKGREYREDRRLNMISIMIMVLCMVVSRIQDFESQSDISKISNSLYAIICCFFVLVLQFNIQFMNNKEREYYALKQLYEKSKEEYKHWKNSIDVINVKCHDLKHRISGLRENYSENYIREIEESVMIYDSALKTENEVLDVILFEKNLFCEKNQIEFIYMVEGAELGFIENEELFALFTNIIDNAIEASLNLEKEKRVIRLSVRKIANMIVIHEENYFSGKLEIADGYPVTTKKDKDNHGFGVRSMTMFVKKKNGTIRFSAENDVFSLTICIPNQ